ncbi:chaperone protein dnaJ 20, chloroplastic-like [Coffea eugenioides]|uniref:chaperone protein dnaJ 20, chloroplastic-like n=1 Tax=Coffea eugenioides TaxID=49369 RepID=UPI000F614E00|nr:chaperone protein dnaJ 20, chloroplastic-like [Coffea eugenioides]
MEVLSLEVYATSTWYGKMFQFNQKGRFKEKICLDEIKRAYRCKALKFHPDACPDPSIKEESTRRFIELRIAYETLSDPILREMYDQVLNLVDLQGRTSHGMNCRMGKRRGGGVEGFPREVWERQIIKLKKRSTQKMEKRNKMGI